MDTVIKNKYIRYDRLLELINFTEIQDNKNLFDFDVYAMNRYGYQNVNTGEISCNTTCCILGNMPLVFPKLKLLKKQPINSSANLQKIYKYLKITRNMYSCLFQGCYYEGNENNCFEGNQDILEPISKSKIHIASLGQVTEFHKIKTRYLETIKIFNNIKK